MDVLPPRQDRRIDLRDRPQEHDMPGGLGVGQAGEKVKIHALIDHPIETEAAVRGDHLVLPPIHGTPGTGEMRYLDAAWKDINLWVLIALGLVEAVAPGEHEAGAVE